MMIRKIVIRAVSLLSITFLAACGGGGHGGVPAAATSGSLDSTFGNNGRIFTEFYPGVGGASAEAVAIQPDGKIVAVGWVTNAGTAQKDFAVARYNLDGSLDTSFNSNPHICFLSRPCQGLLATDLGGDQDAAHAVAIQSDGKIVVAGTSYNGTDFDVALVRYESDGTLDAGFGPAHTGIVTTGFFSRLHDYALAIAVQANGRIVVAGTADNGLSDDIAVARFLADGTLDSSFNNNPALCSVGLPCQGKLASLAALEDGARDVAIQADGKIVVAGYVGNGVSHDFHAVRYNADGTLDTASFGSGTGQVRYGFYTSGDDRAYSVAIQPDGKILIGGFANTGSAVKFAMMRLETDGSVDTGFHGNCGLGTPCNGYVATDFGGYSQNYGVAMALRPDGRIATAGYARMVSTGVDFALSTYDQNGDPVTSFGVDGKVTTDFSVYSDWGLAVAFQGDGRIVVAGSYDDDTGFAIARYIP